NFEIPSEEDIMLDQYSTNHTWSNRVHARLTWTEPLGDPENGNALVFAYRMNYRWNNADKLTYNLPEGYDSEILPPPGLDPDPDYSNSFRNDAFNQNIQIGYKKSGKIFNFEGGLQFVPQMSKSVNLINSDKNIPTRWVWNYAPYLRTRLKLSKQRSLQAFYRGRSSQPSMTQLQPVADISDPMNIKQGNPNLDPSFNHNLQLRFQDYNTESQRSVMLMFFAQYTQNAIVSKTTVDPATAVRTTTYTNVNGVWNARLMNMVSMPFRNKTWSFSNHIFGNANRAVGFSNGVRNNSMTFNIFESPGITFRPDHWELELRPQYNLQLTSNSLTRQNNLTVHRYGGRFDGSYYTPWGLTLQTDLNYTATSGMAAGYDTKTLMWNATISQQFLRSKALTLAVKVYDLLNQTQNIRRQVTANYIDDIEYNSLSRYFMVTLSYKFNSFGKGNTPTVAGGDDMHHGPGGPGGPGGRRPR
ncbi:MAG: outer membrane beta-barrel family protein, partial [Duncaniella sp.]|nr:outer membrane beta-barrel family protein [Duncaniella sp.]